MATTLRTMIASQIPMRAYCYTMGCHHSSELDLPEIAKRLGADHGAMHQDLVGKLWCTKCGGRHAGVRIGIPRNWRGIHQD